MWNTFIESYASHTGNDLERDVNEDTVMRKVEDLQTPKAEVRATVEELVQETKDLRSLFKDFTDVSRANSKMFTFWEE